MDDDALNMRNWGYYEPSIKGHLGLQLMSSMPIADRDTKAFLPGRDPNVMISDNAAFHHRDCVDSEASIPVSYMRDSWLSQRVKFFNILPANPTYGVLPETSGPPHSLQMLQPPPNTSRNDRMAPDRKVVPKVEEPVDETEGVQVKKRQGGGTPKTLKAKKPKDNNRRLSGVQLLKPAAKKSVDVVINGIDMDISGIPIPVCSCIKEGLGEICS